MNVVQGSSTFDPTHVNVVAAVFTSIPSITTCSPLAAFESLESTFETFESALESAHFETLEPHLHSLVLVAFHLHALHPLQW